MGRLITQLMNKAEALVQESQDYLIVESMLKIDYRFLFNGNSIFYNTLFLMQGRNFLGKAYTQDKSVIDLDFESYVGRSLLDCLKDTDYFVRTLALDSAFSLRCPPPHRTYVIETDHLDQKIEQYVHIISNNIEIGKDEKALIVGADMAMFSALKEKTTNLRVTDLSPSRIGTVLTVQDGVKIVVEDGQSKTIEAIRQSDLAIVTGQTFATGTVEEIIDTALGSGTRLVFYMVTCANLAQELILAGTSAVIACGFPPMDMSGKTVVSIFRAT